MNRKSLNLIWLLLAATCSQQACTPETDKAPSAASASTASPVVEGASHVFLGSHIITMSDQQTQPTALAVTGEQIVWMGDRALADAWIGASTQVHELGDRALLPGFIDAHGHLTYLAATLGWANLASPPVGPVTDIATLQSTLRAYIDATKPAPGVWVIGQGYDDSLIAEQRHPTRQELDAVVSEHPIALLHVSGHLVSANSAALAASGINAETPNPPGGYIRREAGSDMPSGVLEETATYPLRAVLSQPSKDPLAGLRDALSIYASHGITTAQDGAITTPGIDLLEAAAKLGQLTLDVVIYPVAQNLESADSMSYPFGPYRNRLRYGGAKLLLDGSPQGKTAYLSSPYAVPPHGQNADYQGYPTFPATTVSALVASLMERDIPIIAHANGDAAAQLLIDAVAAVPSRAEKDHRTVMIHAQTVRGDQLDQMVEYGLMPSFFSAHTFYWGDWHRDSVLGVERASRISPTRSSLERGLPFTVHNDAPVVPPDMIRLLWATTNRITRSGQVLGAEQRLTIQEALAAMTRDAAYQYFEEDRKGTLAVGKLADLVILSANPLAMATEDLLNLKISETWSHGTRVFARDSDG